jgi:hypothetical protein
MQFTFSQDLRNWNVRSTYITLVSGAVTGLEELSFCVATATFFFTTRKISERKWSKTSMEKWQRGHHIDATSVPRKP